MEILLVGLLVGLKDVLKEVWRGIQSAVLMVPTLAVGWDFEWAVMLAG